MSRSLKEVTLGIFAAGCLTTGVRLLARQPTGANLTGVTSPAARADHTPAEKAGPAVAEGPNLATDVALARVEVDRELYEAAEDLFDRGKGSVEEVCRASVRLLGAERDLSRGPADLVGAADRHIHRMRMLESKLQGNMENDALTPHDVAVAKSYRLEAMLGLIEANSGRPASQPAAGPVPRVDPVRLNARMTDYLVKYSDAKNATMLDAPITLSYPEPTPVEDVLIAIRAASVRGLDSGLPIYIDPFGLQDAGKTLLFPVTLVIDKAPTREALRRVVEAMGMTFQARDGLVTIQGR